MSTTLPETHTPGPWNTACDSYGKVQHSRKYDCVWTTVKDEKGYERIVTVAARIEHYPDACLMAAAPALLEALEAMLATYAPRAEETVRREGEEAMHSAVRASRHAISAARGGDHA